MNVSLYGSVPFPGLAADPEVWLLTKNLCSSFKHIKVDIQVSSSHPMVIFANEVELD